MDFTGSLSDYAKSLIPNFLNEEDVQLLRCLKSLLLFFYNVYPGFLIDV